jgi:alpha-beta hydrolase superfamily lysophospholipase
MTGPTQTEQAGREGLLIVHEWPHPQARFVALIAHGYGEHARRYDHVAERLASEGAAVYAPDHVGHGRSEGERALVADGEALTADLHAVAERARAEHPGLPVVLLGHSMGGLVAARYAQRHPGELAALVLSGPVIGGNEAITALLELDSIPEVPIDPSVLSRDPAVGDAYAADPLVYHGPFLRPTLETFRDGTAALAAGPGFGELPTLWIHGSEDMLAPLPQTREAMERLRGPATRERIYEGARHEVLNETNKDEVLDDVARFIREALGS